MGSLTPLAARTCTTVKMVQGYGCQAILLSPPRACNGDEAKARPLASLSVDAFRFRYRARGGVASGREAESTAIALVRAAACHSLSPMNPARGTCHVPQVMVHGTNTDTDILAGAAQDRGRTKAARKT